MSLNITQQNKITREATDLTLHKRESTLCAIVLI